MGVGDGLTCDSAYFDANIEAIRIILFLKQLFDKIEHKHTGGLFAESKIEIIIHMPLGYDKGMAGIHWVLVGNGEGGGGFGDQFCFRVRKTKWAININGLWLLMLEKISSLIKIPGLKV